MKRSVVLSTPLARQTARQYLDEAEDGSVVEFKPATRNLEQNALLHALLTDISKRIPWAGSLRDQETWKRLLTAAWVRTRGESVEFLPAVDGHGYEPLFRRTSKLTKAEFSDLIEYIQSWVALHETA